MEEVPEKVVLKDFHANQKNAREDGEIGPTEERDDERHQHAGHGQGIPCQAQ